jgi:hypothetical protein
MLQVRLRRMTNRSSTARQILTQNQTQSQIRHAVFYNKDYLNIGLPAR